MDLLDTDERSSLPASSDIPGGDTSEGAEAIDIRELVRLSAVDSLLFSRTFFPRTFRQASPRFHREMWGVLDSSEHRLNNIQVFRGGAKTSIARTYMAKRVAFGVSRTIMLIARSEARAINSLKWLQRQIKYNKLFAETFGLSPGKKWSDVECEIQHGIEEQPIWIVAMGITGSVRGINLDDFRPDLILLDDVLDEDNTATLEQREKIGKLIYGALKESLAPRSEAPDAKMVMLQTPLNREDASVQALEDPEWFSVRFPCWTPETEGMPTEYQESIWPERWSSEELRQEKRAAIARNQLSIFLREKECRIISPETSTFFPTWLKRWDTLPSGMVHVLVIDPVPPPSEIQIAKNLVKKDYEAFAVIGFYGPDCYVREVSVNRGHDPLWTVNEFFRLCARYQVDHTIVEAVAYQRTLAWLLRQAMAAKRQYYPIQEYTDTTRSKFNRITDGLTGIASSGHLFIPPDASFEGLSHSPGMAMFVQQFTEYPIVSNDDALEVVAIGCASAQGKLLSVAEGAYPKASAGERKMIAELRKQGEQLGLCP